MRTVIVWIIFIGMVILAILLGDFESEAGNYGSSIQGDSSVVNVTFNAARDSAWIIFASPDDNAYDSVKAVPKYGASSRFLEAPFLGLDSLGGHSVVAKGFSGDVWVDTILAEWNNFGAVASEPGTGFKTYPCTLFVLNSADSTAISNVPVTMRPLGGGRELVVASADVNGRLIYSSEIASISAYLIFQGWNFNAVDTLVIAGTQTDSLFGTAFSPSAPADQTGIFCWLLTPAGDTIDPSFLRYRLVNNADTTTDGTRAIYGVNDWLTVGTGANKIVLNKNWVEIEIDTSLVSFSVYSNDNIYVNGVLDSSSIYQWDAEILGNQTKIYEEVIDTVGNINPFAR